ncbi:winged helix-turn-helix transcriptional regulator [Weissella coleopterorum]|uniref:Winged helix-turn-helix transcriptional regulator n=2 Tax=Weissella coleopterorum TaxID=2714949 RepID=A0A6G8B1T4_9LACO|nr:winged helix-turn-helix transcriptional regulator [Weissella coleopterorum]
MKEILNVLHETDKDYQKILKKLTKEYQLTIAEWKLLQQVENEFDTQEQLSQATGLDTSTLSRQLNSLMKKEMIENQVVGHDHRHFIYQITDTGTKSLEFIQSQYHEIEQQIFSVWSEEEKSMLQILLNRLDKSMQKGL